MITLESEAGYSNCENGNNLGKVCEEVEEIQIWEEGNAGQRESPTEEAKVEVVEQRVQLGG